MLQVATDFLFDHEITIFLKGLITISVWLLKEFFHISFIDRIENAIGQKKFGCGVFIHLKGIHRENTPSNKAEALPKSKNMELG